MLRRYLRFLALWGCSKVYPAAVPSVLMYHSISNAYSWFSTITPEVFRRQMQYLSENGHDFVPLEQVAAYFEEGHALSTKSVCVTFDDGYRDNLTDALPILERFQVPAMVYVATDFVGRHTNKAGARICSLNELRELAAHPLISIGGHTKSHPKLSTLSVPEQREEIAGGKRQLEDWLGIAVEHFAYPYGDLSQETRELVEQLGFRSAVTVVPEYLGVQQDHYRIGRVPIDQGVPDWMFPICCMEATTIYTRLKGG